MKDSCIVHVVAPDLPTASRGSPNESPTADVGSEAHSRFAHFTLADPTPRLCPDAVGFGQCEWVPDPASAVGASSGGRQPNIA